MCFPRYLGDALEWVRVRLSELDLKVPEVPDKPLSSEWATHGAYQVVGNGSVTSELCDTYRGIWGCLEYGQHEGKVWKGQDCHNKGYFRVVHYNCKKPSCPLCFESWGASQARVIEARLDFGSKGGKDEKGVYHGGHGLVEHLSASVPHALYYAKFEDVRAYIEKALEARGITGYCLMTHHFRYDDFKNWYWSPHLHVLGYVFGGYGRCRRCNDQKCVGRNREFLLCDGFEARTRRCFESDGVIVKVAEDRYGVKGERISVFETARYLLSHASIRTDVKRPHAYTWGGVVAYRKLKIIVEKRKFLCAICGLKMGKVQRNWGVDLDGVHEEHLVTDKSSPLFKRDFLSVVYLGEGRVGWVEDYGGSSASWRRKSYD